MRKKELYDKLKPIGWCVLGGFCTFVGCGMEIIPYKSYLIMINILSFFVVWGLLRLVKHLRRDDWQVE